MIKLRDFVSKCSENCYMTVWVNGTLDCSADVEYILLKMNNIVGYGDLKIQNWSLVGKGIHLYCTH